jgi:hypothetical protein
MIEEKLAPVAPQELVIGMESGDELDYAKLPTPLLRWFDQELLKISSVLEAAGFDTVFGYRNGYRRTVFYNDKPDAAVNSIRFDIIAYGIAEGPDDLYVDNVPTRDAGVNPHYLTFDKGHQANDDGYEMLRNKYIPGGLKAPLIHRACYYNMTFLGIKRGL